MLNRRIIKLCDSFVQMRRRKMDLTQTWKILSGFDDIEERQFFTRLNVNAVRPTRMNNSAYNIRANLSNLDIRRYFFSERIVNDWNALPERVKAARNITKFKRELNKYFVH